MNEDRLPEILAPKTAFWEHWGFEPWSFGRLAGVARRQHFVKDGFLGRIAEYTAWDHIVWVAGTADDREALWHSLAPRPEVMTQRFLFLLPEPNQGEEAIEPETGRAAGTASLLRRSKTPPGPGRRIKSFWLGFRGYAEFYEYWPGAHPAANKDKIPPDLGGLVELALNNE